MKRTWKEKLENAWSIYKLSCEADKLARQRIFDGLPKEYKKLSKMMNVCFLLFGASAILFLYKEWFAILWIELCLLLIMIVVAFLMHQKALLVYDEKFRRQLKMMNDYFANKYFNCIQKIQLSYKLKR